MQMGCLLSQMPGVNLPMSEIVYYLLTLFICAVFHEVGHAVAAVRYQRVRLSWILLKLPFVSFRAFAFHKL